MKQMSALFQPTCFGTIQQLWWPDARKSMMQATPNHDYCIGESHAA